MAAPLLCFEQSLIQPHFQAEHANLPDANARLLLVSTQQMQKSSAVRLA